MSHTLDRLAFFTRKTELYSHGHGVTNDEDRSWEEAYRRRWQHDKIVRSTHGVNCTGSCSWKIYVKGGIVRGRPSRLTIHERGPICPITNRAAAPAAPAIPGISIPATA